MSSPRRATSNIKRVREITKFRSGKEPPFMDGKTMKCTLRVSVSVYEFPNARSKNLQIFHCVEHKNGTGGDSVFVDGFYAAKKMKQEHPEDFEFLTKFEVEAEYIGDGHFHKHSAPVIELDKFNNIKHIRFNSYDRSPMAFGNKEECRTYYRALRNLAKYFEDRQNQWQIKLRPGLVMAFDNFRVLHGRTGFTGKRVLYGSYVARSNWLDKARTFGLIH